jgi:proliferating cell nuclear antigen
MIRAKLSAGRLNRALEAVTVLVDTATLQFGPDGLSIETVDPANVAAVSLSMLSGAFSEFEGDETQISIDISRVARITRKINNHQPVELLYDSESHELLLDAGSYEFELSLIDPNSVHSGQRAADIEPPGKVVIEADELHQAVTMADMFSDELILGIDAKREVFYINAIGDNDSMAVSFDSDEDVIEDMEPTKAHTIFSLEYLSDMVQVAPSQSDVRLELGEEYPARIHFKIADGEGRVAYGLAPRV